MQFSVLATFTGNIKDGEDSFYHESTLRDMVRACTDAGFNAEPTESGESEYSYLAEESDNEWFAGLSDLQVSGILTREQFTEWIDSVGAYADTTETMGSLGGPLSPIGIVSDISFETESPHLITRIRVTPVPERRGEFMSGMLARFTTDKAKEARANRVWDRIRKATIAVYGC